MNHFVFIIIFKSIISYATMVSVICDNDVVFLINENLTIVKMFCPWCKTNKTSNQRRKRTKVPLKIKLICVMQQTIPRSKIMVRDFFAN